MTTQQAIAKQIESEEAVVSCNVWNDRIYVNLKGHDRTFKGCSTHKVWISKDGEVVCESGKGTVPAEFNDSFWAIKEKYSK